MDEIFKSLINWKKSAEDMKSLLLWSLMFVFFWEYAFSIRWLSLQHSNLHWNLSSISARGRGIRSGARSPCGIARRRYGLAKAQAKLCRNSLESMPHVQKAAILAAETCQEIFNDRRWNCSSITRAPYLTPDLTRATREQAFVYAISSAALTYTMARACSSGSLYHCTCGSKPDGPPVGNFQWGGCPDNVKFGVYFAKKFIDNVEKNNANKSNKKNNIGNKSKRSDENDDGRNKGTVGRKEIALMNLHNSKVGRRIIEKSLQIQCKCHGVSGSCSIKTCWKGLPTMAEIGQRLLSHYTNAAEVSKNFSLAPNDNNIITDNHIIPLSIYGPYYKNSKNKKQRSEQLVFVSKSPDYCTKDEKLGSVGTVGRRCNVTSNGPNSCRQLCCGRGYRTLVEEKIERCNCKYYNCCYVKCSICRSMTQIYECG